MKKSKTQNDRKIQGYNYFSVFYGYPWQSDFFDKDVLKKLMSDCEKECQQELSDEYSQKVWVEITDLKLKEGGYLTPQLRDQFNNASVGIFEVSDHNPNVYYELGHVQGSGKHILVLKEETAKSVSDLGDIVEIRYSKKNFPEIKSNIVKWSL